jgi:hypothetical protein
MDTMCVFTGWAGSRETRPVPRSGRGTTTMITFTKGMDENNTHHKNTLIFKRSSRTTRITIIRTITRLRIRLKQDRRTPDPYRGPPPRRVAHNLRIFAATVWSSPFGHPACRDCFSNPSQVPRSRSERKKKQKNKNTHTHTHTHRC